MVLWSHVTNKNHFISTTRVSMATTLSGMVTYFERLLTIKSFYALITWSCKVKWQTKIIIYPQAECPWLHTWQNHNLARWATTYKVTPPFDHVVLQDHETNENHYISTSTVPMATKLARMVICLIRLLIIKSYKNFITWSHKTK